MYQAGKSQFTLRIVAQSTAVTAVNLVDRAVVCKLSQITVLQSILIFQIGIRINNTTQAHMYCNTAQPLAIAVR